MAKSARQAVIRIAGSANIRAIDAWHGQLLQALQQSQSIKLDLTEQSELDLSFVQLVYASRLQAAANGKNLTLSAPAHEALCEILQRGGFLHSPEERDFWLHETGGN